MVFNKSRLENKAELLKELWQKTDATSISQRAKKSEREFFAEAFAIYEKGDILDGKVRNFIEEVLK